MKQSTIGLASIIVAGTAAMILFAVFVIAGIVEGSTSGGMDEDSPAAVVLGLTLFAACGLQLLALVLGIVGACQADRSKTLPVIGIALSVLALMGTGLLLAIGLAAG